MQEILFRGIRIDNGEWVYGDLRQEGQRTTIVDIAGNSYEVERESVGQFTGLIDVNGIRIFKGDVIRTVQPNPGRREFTGTVTWSQLFCSWIVDSHTPVYGHIEKYEIVGNTYNRKADDKITRKSEECRYYTENSYWGGGGRCLGTKEVDPCKGPACENWKPKED